jgi:diguanylate cyclase (GGDEF)-like protein/PAS domain S-box-containing protein
MTQRGLDAAIAQVRPRTARMASERDIVRWLGLGSGVVILLVALLAGVSLHSTHAAFRQRAEVATENLARTLEQNIVAEIARVDMALQTVAFALARASAAGADAELVLEEAALQQQSLLGEVGNLRVAGPAGRVMFGSGLPAQARLDVGDRDFFQAAAAAAAATPQPFVSEPFQARLGGRWLLVLARRLSHADGSFAGVVFASLEAEHFREAFAAMQIGTHGAISLHTATLRLVARHSAHADAAAAPTGTSSVSPELRRALEAAPQSGAYVARTAIDGVERANAYRRVGTFPLLLVVGLGIDDYLAPWQAEASQVALLALLAMATLAGSWAFANGAWRQASASSRDAVLQGKRYEALLRTAGDGIHVLDRGGRVVEASDAFGEMLGRSRAELLGMCITAWDLQSTPQSLAERFDRVASAHRATVATQFRRADGSVIDVELLCVVTRIDGEDLLYCSARDVTGRLQADEALRASQAFLLRTGRVAGVGGWQVDLADNTVTWSDETRRIHEVGESHEATVETGLSFYAGKEQPVIRAALRQAIQHGTPWDLELEFVTARGRALWVRTMGEVEFEQGEPARIVGAIQDISERKRLEQAVQDLNATLRAVLESIPASVVVVGVDLRYRFVNQSFERLQGKARAGVIGRPLLEVLGTDEFEWRRPWIERALAGESVGFERLAPLGSTATHLSMSLVPLRLDSGEVDGFIGVAHDVTPQKQEQVRLLQLTLRDSLTGLLNRAGFDSRMRSALDDDHASLVLLCIDLDHFKEVNDTHGHAVGDAVLKQFAQRLLKLVRPTDAVARLGGDEFAIVLEGMRDGRHAHAVADKLIESSREPYRVGKLTLVVGASVGVAYGSPGDSTWMDLFVQADAMLYRAKGRGRGCHAGTSP